MVNVTTQGPIDCLTKIHPNVRFSVNPFFSPSCVLLPEGSNHAFLPHCPSLYFGVLSFLASQHVCSNHAFLPHCPSLYFGVLSFLAFLPIVCSNMPSIIVLHCIWVLSFSPSHRVFKPSSTHCPSLYFGVLSRQSQ